MRRSRPNRIPTANTLPPAEIMYRLDQGDHVFHRRLRQHAVAEVEDVAADLGLHGTAFPPRIGRIRGTSIMSVQELESAVAKLSPPELSVFSDWFDKFIAEAWDARLESDVRAGKLDHLARQADEDFEAGRCTPL
jgi:hypothetical protein